MLFMVGKNACSLVTVDKLLPAPTFVDKSIPEGKIKLFPEGTDPETDNWARPDTNWFALGAT